MNYFYPEIHQWLLCPRFKNTAVLSQGSNPSSSQSIAQWTTTEQDGNTNFQNQQALQSAQQQQQPASETEQKQQGAVVTGGQQQVQKPNDVPSNTYKEQI